MKASAFSYARATSVMNALELLAAHGDKAKVLSGGQSLIPAMNLRLISPELVVDIGGVAELRGIAVRGDVLTIGALTRHVDLLKSSEIAEHAPLLTEAIAHVAHPAVRNKGTLGGSLAHADPAAELPACMLALNATIIVSGQSGERRIAAEDFSRESMRRRCPRKNCLSPLNCMSHNKILRISSANLPGGTATTRLRAWRRRRPSEARF
jgi:carbon-monoxide dehydrogenase medium subunit